MFDPGTKIEILASSTNKLTKPRRGSIGYVCSTLQQNVHESIAIVTSLCSVYFTKYGFEKKHRNEQRKVLFVLPRLSSNKSRGILELVTKDLVGRIKDAKEGRLRELIKSKYKPFYKYIDYVPIVIARPVSALKGCVDLTLDDNEAAAWAKSLLNNTVLRRRVCNAYAIGYYKHLVNRGLPVKITSERLNFFFDKGDKKEVITPEFNARMLVEAIRPVESFIKRGGDPDFVNNADLIPLLFYKPLKFRRYSQKYLSLEEVREIRKRMALVEDLVVEINKR